MQKIPSITMSPSTGLSNSKTFRFLAILSFFAVLSLFISEPAMAQAWAESTKGVATNIDKGLKILVRVVGSCVLVWSVLMIWFGNKRLQDMIPFFIGAAILIASPELLKLIPF